MKGPHSKFKEIPAVSILNGEIVLARGETYEALTIDNKIPDALDLLEAITEQYETIYLTDLNGLIDHKPQLRLIHEITDFCEVWLDAGVAVAENIYDLFVAGANEVVLSSKTLTSLLEFAQAFDLSENLIFELDYSSGIVSPNSQIRNMSPSQLGSELLDIGIDKLVFADLARITTNKSLERDVIVSLVALGLNTFVGGGVKQRDLTMLAKLGASGAVIELTDVLEYGKVEF